MDEKASLTVKMVFAAEKEKKGLDLKIKSKIKNEKKEAFVTNEENVMNTSLTGTKILYLDHESRNDCTLPVPQGPGTGCSILTDLPLTARLQINKKVQLHVNIGSEIFSFLHIFLLRLTI